MPPIVGGQSKHDNAAGQEVRNPFDTCRVYRNGRLFYPAQWRVEPTGNSAGQYTVYNPVTQQYLAYPDPAVQDSQLAASDKPVPWDVKVDGTSYLYVPIFCSG